MVASASGAEGFSPDPAALRKRLLVFGAKQASRLLQEKLNQQEVANVREIVRLFPQLRNRAFGLLPEFAGFGVLPEAFAGHALDDQRVNPAELALSIRPPASEANASA